MFYYDRTRQLVPVLPSAPLLEAVLLESDDSNSGAWWTATPRLFLQSDMYMCVAMALLQSRRILYTPAHCAFRKPGSDPTMKGTDHKGELRGTRYFREQKPIYQYVPYHATSIQEVLGVHVTIGTIRLHSDHLALGLTSSFRP